MTPHLRSEGPISGRIPRTDVPGQPKVSRFPAAPKPESEDNWRNRAACRNVDPEIFFAVGVGLGAERATAEAKAICASCPVIADCAEFLKHMRATLPGSVDGVWAGTSDADRHREERRIRSAQERARARERKQQAAA